MNSTVMEESAKFKRSRFFGKSKIFVDKEVKVYYESVFRCCDKNGDGFVSICELKEFLEAEERSKIPDNLLESVIKKFDKNSDTQLDLEEFIEMVNNKSFLETFQYASNRILRFIVYPHQEKAHPCLVKCITATGEYDRQLKFGWNSIGMLMLSLLQIILFYSDWIYKSSGPVARALLYDRCYKSQVLRYISYSLVHLSQMHLYGNVIVQIFLGIPLEMIHSWRIIVIYIAGACGGCLLHSVNDSDSLVGGSGGVYALFTAHISVVIMNWREMTHPAVHLILFTVILSIDIVVKIYTGVMESISHYCHAGGAVVGLLLGISIVRNIKIKKHENIVWYISGIGLAAFFITLLIKNWTIPRTVHCILDVYNYTLTYEEIISPNEF